MYAYATATATGGREREGEGVKHARDGWKSYAGRCVESWMVDHHCDSTSIDSLVPESHSHPLPSEESSAPILSPSDCDRTRSLVVLSRAERVDHDHDGPMDRGHQHPEVRGRGRSARSCRGEEGGIMQREGGGTIPSRSIHAIDPQKITPQRELK